MLSDTYKLQYNGNTLTYPEWNGYVSYQEPPRTTETYTLLWSGTAYNNITLSEPYSSYDALRFICQNTQDNCTVPTAMLPTYSAFGIDLITPAYKTPTDQPLFSIRSQKFTFNSDLKKCGAVSSFAKSWLYPNSAYTNLYFNWVKIYGVKYANN